MHMLTKLESLWDSSYLAHVMQDAAVLQNAVFPQCLSSSRWGATSDLDVCLQATRCMKPSANLP